MKSKYTEEYYKNLRVGGRVFLYMISLSILFMIAQFGLDLFSLYTNYFAYSLLGLAIFVVAMFWFIYSLGWGIRDIYKRLK